MSAYIERVTSARRGWPTRYFEVKRADDGAETRRPLTMGDLSDLTDAGIPVVETTTKEWL